MGFPAFPPALLEVPLSKPVLGEKGAAKRAGSACEGLALEAEKHDVAVVVTRNELSENAEIVKQFFDLASRGD